MAQWFVSAEDFDVGDAWAETPFALLNGNWTLVVEDTPDGRAFKFLRNAGTGRHWFRIDHGLLHSDQREILVTQAAIASGAADGVFDAPDYHYVTNSTGNNTTGTGVTANMLDTDTLRICSIAPTFTVQATSTTFAHTTKHNTRFDYNDGVYRVKSWTGAEPTDFNITYSSSAYTSNDDSVLSARPGCGFLLYSFGIGTNGDPAPTGPVGPSERRRSPLLLTPW